VPFVKIGDSTLCESQVIVGYLEDAYPAIPLYPAVPAKSMAELIAYAKGQAWLIRDEIERRSKVVRDQNIKVE